MNRKTKGALAIGAGAILLLGGAGSYALWSVDSDIAGGSNISTGNFALDCGTSGAWTDESPTTNGVLTVNPSVDLMVPGDVWKYTGSCTPTFTGKNIKAELSVSGIGTGATLPTGITAVSTANGSPGTAFPAVSGTPIAVTVTLTFDAATGGTTSTNTAVSVDAMAISLKQVRP
ncbi:alternate-type signal peptide domain-containing protein [Gordonia sp. (in: high G+C Gram-positive bacteria)]|uniref:alternate-type signal peptide domain-containing protein n=1 Tax=Gordonia sp. (in: high G+C Gram-positive bacteria) TaxID=84139 RepID=UPI003C71C47C